ncbi:peptidoglycan DD-metalloendopeptidase family protein [Tenacibaculum jejuense]|uniref:Peptidase, M23 family n=1 Tax=Tenacibaculum jejuense TaxID=584609 RepID=A0A238UCJ6_9FLAO|nr:peptidoglycan DD-metalloendopeptidase family protein [Tenacibaculum jejuense]SNR16184.1 Peptidase, M23 family [Tenacibaculum jejuense]
MKEILNSIQKTSLKVIDTRFTINDFIPISISTKNNDLNTFDVSSSEEWSTYLERFLKEKNAKVAFGGYIEKRDIYKRSAYFNSSEENERNIHLGIDLWCDAGTKVLSVLDGEIHSFKNNLNHGDYGPTIIIKHQVKDIEFYSLYGHLSLDSLENIKVGQKVTQEEVIGYLGENTVNGDYAPHLHFQLIVDMQGKQGDYPGVCSKEDVDFYKQNCPNPNLLLKLPNEI